MILLSMPDRVLRAKLGRIVSPTDAAPSHLRACSALIILGILCNSFFRVALQSWGNLDLLRVLDIGFSVAFLNVPFMVLLMALLAHPWMPLVATFALTSIVFGAHAVLWLGMWFVEDVCAAIALALIPAYCTCFLLPGLAAFCLVKGLIASIRPLFTPAIPANPTRGTRARPGG